MAIREIIFLILVILEGLMLNAILIRNKLTAPKSLFPVLFFVIAMTLGICQTALMPVLVGTFFMILCLSQLMVSGSFLSLPIEKTFGAAASLSLATMFSPALMVFLVPLLMTMLNYSLYSWRDWSILLLGLVAPYIPLELYYYLSGNMFYKNYLLFYNLTDIGFSTIASKSEWAMSAVFVILTLVSTVKAAVAGRSRGSNFSKNSAAVHFLLAGSVLSAAYTSVIPVPTQSYAIPFAYSMSVLFQGQKKRQWLWNILLAVLILAVILYIILV